MPKGSRRGEKFLGNEFIPVLIQTTVWEPWYWDGLRTEMSDAVMRIVINKEWSENEKVERLYTLLVMRCHSDISGHPVEKVKEEIKDFLADIKGAGGVVATRDVVYQDVIIAFLNL